MNTVKINVSFLAGPALDWAVAMAENWAGANFEVKPYSTDWAQGGPIIEREEIYLNPNNGNDLWYAEHTIQGSKGEFGPTPLIAAMRCYVASKLGDEVELPEELK